jgi:hypothetical protein
MLFAAAVLCVIGVALALAALAALFRGRFVRFTLRSLASLLCLAVGGGLGILVAGLQGLHALNQEETAARVTVTPTAPGRFAATVHFADGHEESFDLVGDDVYVDAHIIKWTPLVNQLGLHTSYRLERIGGRYQNVAQENTAPRTIFALGGPPLVDLAELARRWPLGRFFDAEYGSTTYVPVLAPAVLDVQVSTSGLLFRPDNAPPR